MASCIRFCFPRLRRPRVAFTHPELLCKENTHDGDEEAGHELQYRAGTWMGGNSEYAYKDGETSEVILAKYKS